MKILEKLTCPIICNNGSSKLFHGDIPEPTTLKISVNISDVMKNWSLSIPILFFNTKL